VYFFLVNRKKIYGTVCDGNFKSEIPEFIQMWNYYTLTGILNLILKFYYDKSGFATVEINYRNRSCKNFGFGSLKNVAAELAPAPQY
jgi:hypothetical protein